MRREDVGMKTSCVTAVIAAIIVLAVVPGRTSQAFPAGRFHPSDLPLCWSRRHGLRTW